MPVSSTNPAQPWSLDEVAEECWRLDRIALSDADGARRSWVMLLPEGKFSHKTHGTLDFSRAKLERLKRLFDEQVLHHSELPLNENHHRGERAPGWIDALEIRPRQGSAPAGLWAQVAWTPLGESLIKDRIYRFISAELEPYTDPRTHEDFGLVLKGAGLTNLPFMREMPAVALSEAGTAAILVRGGKRRRMTQGRGGGMATKRHVAGEAFADADEENESLDLDELDELDTEDAEDEADVSLAAAKGGKKAKKMADGMDDDESVQTYAAGAARKGKAAAAPAADEEDAEDEADGGDDEAAEGEGADEGQEDDEEESTPPAKPTRKVAAAGTAKAAPKRGGGGGSGGSYLSESARLSLSDRQELDELRRERRALHVERELVALGEGLGAGRKLSRAFKQSYRVICLGDTESGGEAIALNEDAGRASLNELLGLALSGKAVVDVTQRGSARGLPPSREAAENAVGEAERLEASAVSLAEHDGREWDALELAERQQYRDRAHLAARRAAKREQQ